LYVARLVRNADAALIGKTVYVMLVPWDWLSRVYSARGAPTTATYHGPADKVCLTALDAPLKFNPAAVVTWCLAHLAGTPDVGSMAGRRLTGYDQERDRLVDSELAWTGYRGSVMGFDKFGLGGVGMANLWMDATSYDFLVQKMSGAPATAAVREGEQALAVAVARGGAAAPFAGTLTVGGEVVGQPAVGSTMLTVESARLDVAELPARGEFPAPNGSGEYALRLLGAGGAVLAEHAFTPEFFTLEEGLDYASFIFNVPAPAGLRSVVLVRGNTVLSTLAASATAPVVTIQAPAAGSYSGTITVRWTGSDPDAGSTLHYTVLYSPDDGTAWQPVALYTTAQELVLDTAQYANCTQCRLKVIANDGFYSAEATSAVFSAANAPRVSLTWPPDGATDAGRFTEVSATFRDAMSAGTITASSFTLVDAAGRPVAGAVTTNVDASEATLTPAAGLAYGAAYTARLAGTIRDAGGRSLGADVVWRFTVERDPVTYTYLPLVVRGSG
jgi:hypothetical protein